MMVLISEGLVVDRELAQLNWLDARAAASHVTIYSLHLDPSTTDASQARPRPGRRPIASIKEEGLQQLAQATRGDVFRIMSNSDFAFQRLALELSGYYLLGFEPDAGRPQRAAARHLRRRAAQRRHRAIAPAVHDRRRRRQDRREPRSSRALRDPLPAAEIPIKLAAYSFRDPNHEKLRLLDRRRNRSLGQPRRAAVGRVRRRRLRRQARREPDGHADARAARAAKGSIQRYFSTVLADPGKYTVKFAVVDDVAAGQRRAGRGRALDDGGSVRATDLLLADGVGRAGELPLAPAVSGDTAGASLHGYLELFADEVEDAGSGERDARNRAASDSAKAVDRHPDGAGDAQGERPAAGLRAAKANLSQLPPGDYVAHAP